MDETVNRILKALDDIKSTGVECMIKDVERGHVYTFGDDRYRVVVTLEPQKWLGLEFGIKGTKLFYPINTDVYDITRPEHKAFANDIGTDIVDFLHNLMENRLRIAYDHGRPMLLIPYRDKNVLLKQGRLLSSKQLLQSTAKIEARAEFQPFQLLED